jgi:hypothetical protein
VAISVGIVVRPSLWIALRDITLGSFPTQVPELPSYLDVPQEPEYQTMRSSRLDTAQESFFAFMRAQLCAVGLAQP